jgi:hypothetical protein
MLLCRYFIARYPAIFYSFRLLLISVTGTAFMTYWHTSVHSTGVARVRCEKAGFADVQDCSMTDSLAYDS